MPEETVDVIIIGAGPAGLFAAQVCGARGLKTTLLEKNRSAGLKLLISGTGQCNITHSGKTSDFLNHYGDNSRFVRTALYNYTNNNVISFFQERGLRLIEVNNGKIFPETLKSRDILNILLSECTQNKVNIKYETPVLEIAKSGDLFKMQTPDGLIFSKSIMICTGGKSYPKTGSSGDGYHLASQFGHSITQIKPALSSVIIYDFHFQNCAGISIADSVIQLYRNSKKIRQTQGDILFTHKGLSGPGILDFSRFLMPNDTIRLSLTTIANSDVFEKLLLEQLSANGKKTIKNCLSVFEIPERLLLAILNQHNIDPAGKAADLGKAERKVLVKSITELEFTIDKLGSFKEAMTTTGGVALNEVNQKTMESKLVKSLFFAGEVLDVDGDTGGYNIQFAISSGVLAAQNI
jgi:predicted Rossmann fold flavoprotein